MAAELADAAWYFGRWYSRARIIETDVPAPVHDILNISVLIYSAACCAISECAPNPSRCPHCEILETTSAHSEHYRVVFSLVIDLEGGGGDGGGGWGVGWGAGGM